jgi:hypothetical protein
LELSIRPAILVDAALGAAFVMRYLDPLAALGRLGAELETTLCTWFDHGMHIEDTARSVHVHPNTPQAAACRGDDRREPQAPGRPDRAVVSARAQAAGVQGSGPDMKVRVYEERVQRTGSVISTLHEAWGSGSTACPRESSRSK